MSSSTFEPDLNSLNLIRPEIKQSVEGKPKIAKCPNYHFRYGLRPLYVDWNGLVWLWRARHTNLSDLIAYV